jgi:hypothetical protein
MKLRIIMNIAHLIKNNENCSLSEALKKSWKIEKSKSRLYLSLDDVETNGVGADFHLHSYGVYKYWSSISEMQRLPIEIMNYVKQKRVA